MSYFPQPGPYGPPQPPTPMDWGGYPAGATDLLGPARRAAVLMWVLGVVLLLLGGCLGALGAGMPTLRQQPQFEQALRQLETQAPGDLLGMLFVIMGVVTSVVAVAYIVLGFFTRRGGLGAIITSLVLSGLVAAYLVLNTVVSLASGAGGLGGACIGVIGLALHGVLITWLIQAVRASARVRALQAQYAAQPWPAPQSPQAYGYPPPSQHGQPSGFGYPTQAPPAPPQAPSPPPGDAPRDA